MTEEETRQLKEKFENKFPYSQSYADQESGMIDFSTQEELWQFIQDEIITPYEEKLEQVERETKRKTRRKLINWFGECVEEMLGRETAIVLMKYFKETHPSLKSQNTQTK